MNAINLREFIWFSNQPIIKYIWITCKNEAEIADRNYVLDSPSHSDSRLHFKSYYLRFSTKLSFTTVWKTWYPNTLIYSTLFLQSSALIVIYFQSCLHSIYQILCLVSCNFYEYVFREISGDVCGIVTEIMSLYTLVMIITFDLVSS